jgi:undecaprenyl-diphosphatase
MYLRITAGSESKSGVRHHFLLLLFGLGLAGPLAGQPSHEPAPSPAKPLAELRVRDSVILGLVEGLTEYLPVSSMGHVMVADQFFGLEGTTQLRDANGRPLWARPPRPGRSEGPALSSSNGQPLTVKVASDTFTVVTQIGAILAVAILFRSRFREIGRGIVGRSDEGRRLLLNLVVAFLPAGIVGFLFNHWILEHLVSIGPILTAQLVGAALMVYAEWWRKNRAIPAPGLDGSRLPLRSALGIGILQCASFWPGMSRSMTTIVGGYFAGMDGRRSGEFSFLLGFLTLSAASLYKARQSGPAMIEVFGWPHVLLGGAVATVAAMLAVKLFLSYLSRHGLIVFAVYRVAFAVFLGFWSLR